MSESPAPRFGAAIPLFRIFDVAKAREFYIDYLGFETVFEHRFAADLPLFWSVRRDTFALYLSEHHGDGTPGSRCTVLTTAVDAFAAELAAKRYRFSRSGVVETPWGSRDLTVTDPFANGITFSERIDAAEARAQGN